MSRPRSDYKICEFCGASLDVGERCDCKESEVNRLERSKSNAALDCTSRRQTAKKLLF